MSGDLSRYGAILFFALRMSVNVGLSYIIVADYVPHGAYISELHRIPDAALCGAFGFKPEDASYLGLAGEVFGCDPESDVEKTVTAISSLIPARSG